MITLFSLFSMKLSRYYHSFERKCADILNIPNTITVLTDPIIMSTKGTDQKIK